METRQAKANHLPLEHCIESVNPGQMQKCQIGAYRNLESAKKECKEGYSVYDEAGNTVYSNKPKAEESTGANPIIRDGQIHARNFAMPGLGADGIRGPRTKEAGIRVLQQAMNLDYGAGLALDGKWGKKSESALGKHTVRGGGKTVYGYCLTDSSYVKRILLQWR